MNKNEPNFFAETIVICTCEAVTAKLNEMGFNRTNKMKPQGEAGHLTGETERWSYDYRGRRGEEEAHVGVIIAHFKINTRQSYWRVQLNIWYSRLSPRNPNKTVRSAKQTHWYNLNEGKLICALRDLSAYIKKKSVPEKQLYRKSRPKLDYVYRKHEGDDCYSWAVFRRGSCNPIYTGMSQTSARAMAQVLHDKKTAS